VHDLLDGFIKVSATEPNAFRSREPVGTLSRQHGFLRSNMGYLPASRQIPLSEQEGLAYVAPPLVMGRDLSAAIRFLEALPNIHVVLEASERIAFAPEQQQYLFFLVQERVKRGVATILADPIEVDPKSGHMKVDNDLWRESAFVKGFTRAGGVVRVGQHVSEIYLEAVLSLGAVELLEATDRLRRAYGVTLAEEIPSAANPCRDMAAAITLRYIPDPEMFRHATSIAEKVARTLVIEGIPGGVLPAKHVEALKEVVAHGHPVEVHVPISVVPGMAAAGKNRRLYAASKAFLSFMEYLSRHKSGLVKAH
jgi:hypothetical protein